MNTINAYFNQARPDKLDFALSRVNPKGEYSILFTKPDSAFLEWFEYTQHESPAIVKRFLDTGHLPKYTEPQLDRVVDENLSSDHIWVLEVHNHQTLLQAPLERKIELVSALMAQAVTHNRVIYKPELRRWVKYPYPLNKWVLEVGKDIQYQPHIGFDAEGWYLNEVFSDPSFQKYKNSPQDKNPLEESLQNKVYRLSEQKVKAYILHNWEKFCKSKNEIQVYLPLGELY